MRSISYKGAGRLRGTLDVGRDAMNHASDVPGVRFQRRASLPGVEFMWTDGQPRASSVFHERYAIAVSLGGEADWFYRRREFHGRPGCLSMMEPGESHRTGRIGQRVFVAFIDPERVAHAAMAAGARRSVVHLGRPQTEHPGSDRLFVALARALLGDDEGPSAEELTAVCLQDLVQTYAEDPATRPAPCSRAVHRARTRLEDDLDQNIPLEDLAREARVTPFHLIRSFRAATGLTPHQYVIQRRLARARALLREGCSATEVAHAVGFGDQSHLHRHFKRVMGLTPGQYARATR
jgi:AraC-like DNA-binding protein